MTTGTHSTGCQTWIHEHGTPDCAGDCPGCRRNMAEPSALCLTCGTHTYAEGLADGGYMALSTVAAMLDADGSAWAAHRVRQILAASYPAPGKGAHPTSGAQL